MVMSSGRLVRGLPFRRNLGAYEHAPLRCFQRRFDELSRHGIHITPRLPRWLLFVPEYVALIRYAFRSANIWSQPPGPPETLPAAD